MGIDSLIDLALGEFFIIVMLTEVFPFFLVYYLGAGGERKMIVNYVNRSSAR